MFVIERVKLKEVYTVQPSLRLVHDFVGFLRDLFRHEASTQWIKND